MYNRQKLCENGKLYYTNIKKYTNLKKVYECEKVWDSKIVYQF